MTPRDELIEEKIMSNASTPCPADHPLMIAWNAHKKTDEYKNSKHWALTIQPMIQVGDPDADRKRYQLMPVEQREQHIEGSLWATFCAGYNAAFAARSDAQRTAGRQDVQHVGASTSPETGGCGGQHVTVEPAAPTATDAELIAELRELSESEFWKDNLGTKIHALIGRTLDRIEALAKDAADAKRYRWLRNYGRGIYRDVFNDDEYDSPNIEEGAIKLDVAIDAALSERKGE